MSTGLQYRPQTAAVTPPGTMEAPVCLGLAPALYRVNAMSVLDSNRQPSGQQPLPQVLVRCGLPPALTLLAPALALTGVHSWHRSHFLSPPGTTAVIWPLPLARRKCRWCRQ